jgi:ABC-2 type transport system permease protein
MANVIQSPGLVRQIWLIAALRWKILRNNLRKKNSQLDIIGLIASGLVGALLVIGLSFASYSGAYFALSSGRVAWMGLLFWAIFIWWQVFPVFVAGFGASFEFRTLLRFPMNLSAFFIISLAYGLADFSALAALCWLLAMTLGATAAKPEVLPVMILVSILFVLMNVTLERLIGSWLERLLSRRRSREIFLGLFVLSMVSIQFIAPALQRYGHQAEPWVWRLLPLLEPFPPSLAVRSIAGAVSHQSSGVLWGAAGIALYAVLFGALLWMRCAAQYAGEELSETAAPVRRAAKAAAAEKDEPDTLSLLSPQVAAVVRKEFRYLTRNGFAFLTLLLPPLLVLLFAAQISTIGEAGHKHAITPDLFFPGMMAYLILILMAPAYNCFAYEGRGIQSYYMAPLRFRNVFLGKNLMLAIALALEIALSIIVLAFRVGVPSAPRFAATLAAIIFTVVGQFVIANWSSLNFPRKLEFGQMRGQRQSGMAVLVAMGAQILLGGISALVFLAGFWTGNRWLPAEIFAFLAAAAVGGYLSSLDAFTELAEQKKETLIEALCR